MFRPARILMISIALGMGTLAITTAVIFGHPLVDPDGFLGPSWLRLPLLVSIAFLVDLVPRTLWISRLRPSRMKAAWVDRYRTHWTRPRMTLVLTGLLCFYVTYVSYRNLKSELPFVEGRNHKFDRELDTIDRALFLNHSPGLVLHHLLGTSVSAEVLSTFYLWFLPMVPLCLTAWLIWARDLAHGYWFASSQCVAWTLGTISYYALPTLGPGIAFPYRFTDLPDTGALQLMTSITWTRIYYLNDATGSLQSIAGFASLHVGITLLVTMMVQYTTPWRWLKIAAWINCCLIVVSTIYFGWHYLFDDLAGVTIALVSFYVGGLVSNQTFRRHPATPAERPAQVTTV